MINIVNFQALWRRARVGGCLLGEHSLTAHLAFSNCGAVSFTLDRRRLLALVNHIKRWEYIGPSGLHGNLLPLDLSQIHLILLMLGERALEVVFVQVRFAAMVSLHGVTYRQKIFLAIFWFSRSMRSSSALRELKCNDFASSLKAATD